MYPTKADNRIEEKICLIFVANSLNEEISIYFGEDVEVSTENLYEVNHVCETTKDLHTLIQSSDILSISLTLILSSRLETRCFNGIPSRHFLIDRWRSSPTST